MLNFNIQNYNSGANFLFFECGLQDCKQAGVGTSVCSGKR